MPSNFVVYTGHLDTDIEVDINIQQMIEKMDDKQKQMALDWLLEDIDLRITYKELEAKSDE